MSVQQNPQKETVGHALSPRTECSFTPGPWKTEFFGSPRVLATDEKGDFPICDIRGWGHLTGKGCALGLPEEKAAAIQDANARLIAAAPDLFKQLSLVRTMLANSAAYDEVQGHTEDAGYTRKVISEIDAVLSAAKGGA